MRRSFVAVLAAIVAAFLFTPAVASAATTVDVLVLSTVPNSVYTNWDDLGQATEDVAEFLTVTGLAPENVKVHYDPNPLSADESTAASQLDLLGMVSGEVLTRLTSSGYDRALVYNSALAPNHAGYADGVFAVVRRGGRGGVHELLHLFSGKGSSLHYDALCLGASMGVDAIPDTCPGATTTVMEISATNKRDTVANLNAVANHANGPPSPNWSSLPEIPGFQFGVRVSANGQVLPSGPENCLPETVCYSVSVEGRSEVFVRIVGPKPNGRLWVNILKFTTSELEVWVKQDSSGKVQYYDLSQYDKGRDGSSLPGFVDTEAFLP